MKRAPNCPALRDRARVAPWFALAAALGLTGCFGGSSAPEPKCAATQDCPASLSCNGDGTCIAQAAPCQPAEIICGSACIAARSCVPCADSSVCFAADAGTCGPGSFCIPQGTHSRLVFVQQKGSAVAGAVLSLAVTVEIVDAAGDLTSSGAMVTLTSTAALRGTSTVAAVNGVVTFSELSIATPGHYTLTASSGSLATATSAAFDVSASTVVKLAFVQAPPASARSGIALSPTVAVALEDSAGNVVTSASASIHVTASGGTLSGGTAQATSNGIANFPLVLSGSAGSYTVTAVSDGLPPLTSGPIALSAGEPVKLAFFEEPPASAQSGLALPQTVKVAIEDSAGNLVTTSNAAISLMSSGGALSGGAAQNAAGGVAIFSLTLAALAGNYTLTALAAGLSAATSTPIAVSPGAAAKLDFTQSPPSSARSGTAMAAFQVSVEDSAGNLIAGSSAQVTLTGSGGAPLTAAVQSAAAGVASFSPALTGLAGNYQLTASSTGLDSATSGPIALGAGDATQLVFAQEPAVSARSGVAMPVFQVAVEDSAGNV